MVLLDDETELQFPAVMVVFLTNELQPQNFAHAT
jgi:hypothetical protein